MKYHVEGWVQITYSIETIFEAENPDIAEQKFLTTLEGINGDVNNYELSFKQVEEQFK